MWHVVLDGRGYYNLSKGIKLDRNPDHKITWPVIHLQVPDGSKYFEAFELEYTRLYFCGYIYKNRSDSF